MASAKTNAVRLLERLGVRFELRTYDVDPEDLAAETVARKESGCRRSRCSRRSLPGRGDKQGVCLAVVPGNCELRLEGSRQGDRR